MTTISKTHDKHSLMQVSKETQWELIMKACESERNTWNEKATRTN